MDTLKRQSGAIPFLSLNGQPHLVLVTSHVTGGWILPKGSLEPDMTPAESAANEAEEEAGVIGEICDTAIDSYRYIKRSTLHEVAMYPLAVSEILDEWDEKSSRVREIVPLDIAFEMVEDNLLPVLGAFRDWICDQSNDHEPSA